MLESDKDIISKLGGKGWCMIKLQELCKNIGASCPKFKIFPSDELIVIEKNAQPKMETFSFDPKRLPKQIRACGNNFSKQFARVFDFFCIESNILSNYPVLKSSFVKNNDFNTLSFAGVGTTEVTKSESETAFFESLKRILIKRYSSYSFYYRSTHKCESVDIGIIGMELLSKQIIWGTIWGIEDGFAIFFTREDMPQLFSSMYMYNLSDNKKITLDAWALNLGIEQAFELATFLCNKGAQFENFNIEFCISSQKKLTLTQWRPIPIGAEKIFKKALNNTPEYQFASPYSDFAESELPVYYPHKKLFTDIALFENEIINNCNKKWVIPYNSSDLDLFKILCLGQISNKVKEFPPIIVLHKVNQQLGHLHAIAVEDPKVRSISHLFEENFNF